MSDAQNSQATDGARAAASSRSSMLLVILAVAGLALGAGFFVASRMGQSGSPRGSAPSAAEAEVGPVVELEPFIANLVSQDDELHYLKCRLSIEVADKEAAAELARRTPLVRQQILLALSGLRLEDTLGAANATKLHDVLAEQVTETAGKDVARRVFLTEFLVQ